MSNPSRVPSEREVKRGTRNDPETTRANIIEVATREFAEHGLAGARIDMIAAKTKTSKRMIYYYFGSKDGLYRKVLETAYGRIRTGEARLRLRDLDPVEAMEELADFTFEHHRSNPDFVRLVMIENIHNAEHLTSSEEIRATNARIIELIEEIYEAGVSAGEFRPNLDPLHIHWLISSQAFYNISNRATFSQIFGRQLADKDVQDTLKLQVIETVMRYVLEPKYLNQSSGS